MRTLEDCPGYRLKIQSHSPLPNSQTEYRLEKRKQEMERERKDKEGQRGPNMVFHRV
jgi:G:T-mismatch repair DNA endonuclease (very short patch repair protein)